GPASSRICTSAASGSARYTSAIGIATAAGTSFVSSHVPPSATRIANASKTIGGANHTRPTTRTTRTAPLMTRVTGRRPPRCGATSLGGDGDGRRLDAAVPGIALLIREDRFEQMAASEVGPQRLGEPDLRIRDLPQQEVADAHLAARPDEEIGIRLPRRVEELAEPPLVEIVGVD